MWYFEQQLRISYKDEDEEELLKVRVLVVIKGGGWRQLFNPPRHTAITVNRVCLHLIITVGGKCATTESCRRSRWSFSVSRMFEEERNFQLEEEEVEKNKMEMGCYYDCNNPLTAYLYWQQQQGHFPCADVLIPDCSSEHFRQFPRMLDGLS